MGIPKKSTGTEIKWKPGKNITTRSKKAKPGKKQRKKGGNAADQKVEPLSFFDMFGNYVEDEKFVEDPDNPKPSLYLVDEVIEAIGNVAGEESLFYYLNIIKDELDGMEEIDEEDEEDEDDEDDTPVKKNRKVSTKSGKSNKSGKKNKGKSRKN